MGDGTKKNPYTREDLFKLIKKISGEIKRPELEIKVPPNLAQLGLSGKELEEEMDLSRLDLSGKVFEEGIELHGLYLAGVDLKFAHLEGAQLQLAHLQGADLSHAHLEGADLRFAHLERTNLQDTHLEGANLMGVHLEGADLALTEFPRDTNMESIDWGNYILEEERMAEEKIRRLERGERMEAFPTTRGYFGNAMNIYRRLKTWHTEHGLYDIAGKFFYREMEVRRKAQSWEKEPHLKIWYWVMRMLCGYGERPERVVISAAAIVFGLAIAYFLWGSFSSSSFTDTLYYSVASFTALGYGNWAPQPTGWAKGVGAAEAVLGVSMMALFLVTFTRKMIR